MAIIENFWLKGASKKLGGAVLYEAMGQTRARWQKESVSNPRTEAQMSQRIRWSNLVNFYRANASWMKYAFETKKTTQSEYNKFMSLNVSSSRIALTKQAAAAGAAVADSYTMTQGSLPSIEWREANGVYISNIYTGDGTEILSSTTVGEFSSWLVANNPAIQEGDQLSFIRVSQMVNGSTGYPYVIVRKYEVIISLLNTRLLNDYIPVEFLSAENIGDEYTLNVLTEGRKGGFCMILSRTRGGKTYVSTQQLVNVNNEDVISNWSGTAAVRAAIDSYGPSEDVFLSSASANTATGSPIGNSILYMTIRSADYAPGIRVPDMNSLMTEEVELIFSDSLSQTDVITNPQITLTNYTTLAATASVSAAGSIDFTMPDVEQADVSAHPYIIEVTVNGTPYRIVFASPSDYTGGGLE